MSVGGSRRACRGASVLSVGGPLLLALVWLRAVAAPGLAVLVSGGVLVGLTVGADVFVIARRRFRIAGVAILAHGLLAALLFGHRAASLLRHRCCSSCRAHRPLKA